MNLNILEQSKILAKKLIERRIIKIQDKYNLPINLKAEYTFNEALYYCHTYLSKSTMVKFLNIIDQAIANGDREIEWELFRKHKHAKNRVRGLIILLALTYRYDRDFKEGQLGGFIHEASGIITNQWSSNYYRRNYKMGWL